MSTSTPSITITVKQVNRSLSSQEMLNATERVQYTDKSVVASIPSQGEGVEEDVPVEFFKLGYGSSPDELAQEYEERGITPDPYAVCQANTDDPAFADSHPNAVQWRDANGNLCYAAFGRDGGERHVSVRRDGDDWGDGWWFGGVRKLSA